VRHDAREANVTGALMLSNPFRRLGSGEAWASSTSRKMRKQRS